MLEQESVDPILAGSDSVTAHVRTIILYVSANPVVLAHLRAEIDVADAKGLLSEVPRYHEVADNIPYIELIMKEAFRIYPIVGGALPWEAPKGGTMISGYLIPGGTPVGINQWAVTRNKNISGDDEEVFRPERWKTLLQLRPRRLKTSSTGCIRSRALARQKCSTNQMRSGDCATRDLSLSASDR